jgi:hypothetical protein
MVTAKELEFFKKSGYLIVRDFLSEQETKDLQKWAKEVRDWKATEEADFMPYEVGRIPEQADIHLLTRRRRSMLAASGFFAEPRIMPTATVASGSFSAARDCSGFWRSYRESPCCFSKRRSTTSSLVVVRES